MLSDPVWYFYLFWIPGYLQERAGLSLSELGVVGGLPFIAAVLVCMVLGRVVDRFTERGHDSIRLQLWIFALTAALMPLGSFITMTSRVAVALAILTLRGSVCKAWVVGHYVLLAGLFPARVKLP